jgi:murein DD-endopeptidase MepM/ murein hydrolase activator NlpD
LYRRGEFGTGSAVTTAALTYQNALAARGRVQATPSRAETWKTYFSDIDLVEDLGRNIGSAAWWRGLLSCTLLCSTAFVLTPPLRPINVSTEGVVSGDAWEETRAQTIAPLAWGGDTGRRMAAGDLVVPLGTSPERPSLDLTATLGQGDGFTRVLERAGIGGSEARRAASLVATAVPLSAIPPGTLMKIVLGRRINRNMARPLDSLTFRAQLDMSLSLRRSGDGLVMDQLPIAVDRSPLRVQGLVGDSLYRSARAAGVPAKAVEAYIKAIASKLSLANDIDASSRYDLVVEQARAETGEIEYGKLLFAGLERAGRRTQLLQWTIGGRTEWFEASGVGQRRGGMSQPIENGRITSGFGMRFHPILGYSRFHRGIDFGAVYGTPIRAVTDGIVAFAGRNGGYGNHIRLNHSGGLGSSYSHMSRFAVGAGARVLQGQVIGYVGSTGMSTGPHLHFEVYRGGQPVSPRSVTFESSSLLSGRELEAFKSRIAAMQAIPLTGATQ